MTERILASKFKAKCSKLIAKVQRTKRKIIITKRNKPIAELVPIEEETGSLFGKMKGTIHVIGDIKSPINQTWDNDLK